jgi:hypothetical protein
MNLDSTPFVIMKYSTILILAGFLAGCSTPQPSAPARDEQSWVNEPMPAKALDMPWQTNANLFVRAVQDIVNRDGLAPGDAIRKLIGEAGSVQVQWTGRVGGFHKQLRPWLIEIEMDELFVVHDGKQSRIRRIGLAPNTEQLKAWEGLDTRLSALPWPDRAKQQVTFRTELFGKEVFDVECNDVNSMIVRFASIGGKPSVVFGVAGCSPVNSPPHSHLILATRWAELVSSLPP